MSETLWADQRTPALRLVENEHVATIRPDHYEVTSLSTPGHTYDVTHQTGTWACTCDHHLIVGRQCIHILAVRYILGVGREVKPRDWSAYNKGTVAEHDLFDTLLQDLASTAPTPIQEGPGRPSLPIPEQIYCAVKKVHSQQSSRRAAGLYKEAQQDGVLEHAPHFNAVSKFLNREDTTQILRALIQQSAAPLAGLEMDFAVDSTGFSPGKHGEYRAAKHGGTHYHRWVKAHAIVGVKTGVVTDIVATDDSGADCPQFPELVANTAQRFHINEVSADKAYAARYNHNAVRAAGGVAYIPFKTSHTGKAQGSYAWAKAFHLFQANREEFDAHYHKRSNVEATFGAVKAKFGERLKSKNSRAQLNEMLCKVLGYNITLLIRWMHEAQITLNLGPQPSVEFKAPGTPALAYEAS